MRQPTRPFITAYKKRSSKSRPSDTWTIKEVESAQADSTLNELSASLGPEPTPDAAYLAALKAADAVFGRKADGHPLVPEQPSHPPTGRVLPNLLQDDVENARPENAAPKKARRVRQPAKVKAPVPTESKRPKRRAITAAPTPSGQPATKKEPEIIIENFSRARRAIQEKWVSKTSLKAGEKWKRRLSRFAR
jgi:hypothetical protein